MKGSRDKYNAGFIICDHLFPIIILKGNAPCAYNISFQEINSCLSCYKPMSLNPSLIRVCISLRVLHPHSIIFPFCSHWADVWNHRLVFHTWYMHSLRLDSWWESVNPHCSKFSSWRGYNLFQKNVEDLRTKVHHGDPTQIQADSCLGSGTDGVSLTLSCQLVTAGYAKRVLGHLGKKQAIRSQKSEWQLS